jgi:glutamate racemase
MTKIVSFSSRYVVTERVVSQGWRPGVGLNAGRAAATGLATVGRMRIALINSGLGLLAAAAELRRQSPDVELILAMDPDGMPWGSRTPADIAQRSLACAHAAAAYGPDALVFACNTGSVHALDALRSQFEPRIPVVGTVPAIKPAAAAGQPIAIWATAATTGSAYQHALIAQFAASVAVTEVPCPGLADAINAGDEEATAAAVAAAAARTPSQVSAVVLGCTEYELAAQAIAAARPGVSLYGSAVAVAAQALRRAVGSSAQGSSAVGDSAVGRSAGHGNGQSHAGHGQPESGAAGPPLRVLLSGRPGDLPPAAFRYREGRFLVRRPDRAPAATGPGAGSSSRPA